MEVRDMPRRAKSAISKLADKGIRANFGNWVVDRRTAAPYHFTQAQAAKAIGISRGHLSKIENGKVPVPKKTVISIAKAVHCPKEIALRKAGFKVKESTLDEKAYVDRILDNLKINCLQEAIYELIHLYYLINTRKRKRKIFNLGTARDQVADVIFLLHALPTWVRIEVLDYFNRVQEQEAKEDAYASPASKNEAVKTVGSQIQAAEEKMKDGINVCPTNFIPDKVGLGADFFIAISIKTSGPMPPDYSLLSIEACVVTDTEQSFHIELKPLNSNAVPDVLIANQMVLEKLEEHGVAPQEATLRFVEWVQAVAGFGRPVFVGMTATLDWSFINWYTRKFTGSNPFGYGAIDIRTYEMARLRSSWGAVTIGEDHGELNFWRNQSHYSALEQAKMIRESFWKTTKLS
jgi:transcriptional regulator with XRE-family HTH domain